MMTLSKPLTQSRTAIVAFVILVLNAAAAVFAGANLDAGPVVDALFSGAYTEAITVLLSVLVILFRAGAWARIEGLIRRPA